MTVRPRASPLTQAQLAPEQALLTTGLTLGTNSVITELRKKGDTTVSPFSWFHLVKQDGQSCDSVTGYMDLSRQHVLTSSSSSSLHRVSWTLT